MQSACCQGNGDDLPRPAFATPTLLPHVQTLPPRRTAESGGYRQTPRDGASRVAPHRFHHLPFQLRPGDLVVDSEVVAVPALQLLVSCRVQRASRKSRGWKIRLIVIESQIPVHPAVSPSSGKEREHYENESEVTRDRTFENLHPPEISGGRGDGRDSADDRAEPCAWK